MCDLCKKVGGLSKKEALDEIGRMMIEKPAQQDHLSDLLDKLLETGQEASEDPELALEWELAHRRRED